VNAEPAIRIRDLSFVYPDGVPGLRGVSLDVASGETIGIVGPNGAGKSTLLLHLNGLLRGTGSVRVAGIEVRAGSLREVRRAVGLVFQDPEDQLFMPTVYDDVAFGPLNMRRPAHEMEVCVRRALALVGMTGFEKRSAHHLSFGEKKRVALATVLACDPPIIAFDEPTSNLDPAGRRELAGILAGLDVTLLMVTHDLPWALQLCPRAVILDGGRVAADGPTRDLLADRALLAAHRLELPYGFDPVR